MCRNIKTLANFEPPATTAEIRASALQFVRKLSGTTRPSRANEAAFQRAVDDVAAAAQRLIASLETSAPPRNRDEETRKARERSRRRFPPPSDAPIPSPLGSAPMLRSTCASLIVAACLPAMLAAQANDGPFTVGTATAQPGTTATGVLAVPPGLDSGLAIPVAVIRGERPGPVVAFVAGSHGTEYSSIVAMQQLIPRIDAPRLAGTVVVIPIINIASFESMTPHLNPVDHKSMNGNYPGDSTGTQTERALALITSRVLLPADVIVDLHGGDLDENLRPYSYWFRGGRPAQDSAGLQLALAFGLDHIIVTDVDPTAPATGRTLSGQALLRGKTVLVAEAGRSGIVAPGDLTALVDGSLNVLGTLHMLDRQVQPVRHPIWLNGAGARIAADSAGMFFAAVDRDVHVVPGQLLGYTTNFLGQRTGEIRSPIDGLVAFIRGVPSMPPHATLANVLPILAAPGPWKGR